MTKRGYSSAIRRQNPTFQSIGTTTCQSAGVAATTAAWALYEAGHWAGRPVRLIGLGMADLGTPDPIQPDLFDGGAERPTDSARDRRLTATIDRIQSRFGVDALRQGMSADQQESGDD